MRREALAAIVLLAGVSAADAATVTIEVPQSGDPVIHIAGPIVFGDEKKLAVLIPQGRHRADVSISGPGGNVASALEMGTIIHAQDRSTSVPPHSKCASACALVWIAGVARTVSADSDVGFHAAYDAEDPSHKVMGGMNALVGAYPFKLGYNFRIIFALTDKPPSQIRWLGEEQPGRHLRRQAAAAVWAQPSRRGLERGTPRQRPLSGRLAEAAVGSGRSHGAGSIRSQGTGVVGNPPVTQLGLRSI